VQLTVVNPSANVDPEAGEQTAATDPSTMSGAVMVYVATAPDELVASRGPTLSRSARAGPVVSSTVITYVPVDVLPRVSEAEHVTCVSTSNG
jgi:hypothetical protein